MSGIATIILNWNNSRATIACAESVLRALENLDQAAVTPALYLVDNGSTDLEISALRNWVSDRDSSSITLLENNSNLGFARGMNVGIKRAIEQASDYIWLLNNDTVVDVNAAASMYRFSEDHPQYVVLGATIVNSDGTAIQAAGGHRYYKWLGYNRALMRGKPLRVLERQPSVSPDYIDGASMWIQGKLLARTAGLAEDYYLYYEELTLNHQLIDGEGIAWCPDAIVYHEGGGSSNNRQLQARAAYHAARSAFTYTWTYAPVCLPTVVLCRVIGVCLRAIGRAQPSLLGAVFHALIDFSLARPSR